MARIVGVIAAIMLATALPGCKIVKTPSAEEKAAAEAKNAFDPAARVDAIWQSHAIPDLDRRAGDLKAVQQLAAASPDEAGAKFGNPRKQSGSPWTYAVKLSGRIVAADTTSRAATVDVDVDGDGKADAKIQIGPAIRGTAIRDALEFVDFNSFKNQIEWAQFGKAFNEKANASFLAALPRDGLVGKSISVTGAFPQPAPGQLPLITPSALTLGQ